MRNKGIILLTFLLMSFMFDFGTVLHEIHPNQIKFPIRVKEMANTPMIIIYHKDTSKLNTIYVGFRHMKTAKSYYKKLSKRLQVENE